MVEITLFEVNVEEGSFAANLPFSSGSPGSEDETETEDEATAIDEEDGGGGSKGLVLLGVFVSLIVATAAVKYLTGDDEDEEGPATPA